MNYPTRHSKSRAGMMAAYALFMLTSHPVAFASIWLPAPIDASHVGADMSAPFNPAITYLKNVGFPDFHSVMPLGDALDRIMNGFYQKRIADLPDSVMHKDAYRIAKAGLPCYAFAGRFGDKVKNECFKQSSGLFHFDIDHLSAAQLEIIRETLQERTDVVFIFTSPSGRGLKAGIRINPELVKNDADFKRVYYALEASLAEQGICIDTACKDVKRACFISYDPGLYYNQYAIEAVLPVHHMDDTEATFDGSYDDNKPPLDDITLENAVSYLPPIDALDYQEWLSVLMAFHYQFNGSVEARAIVDEWSSLGSGYKEGEVKSKWAGFAMGSKSKTFKTVILLYNKYMHDEEVAANSETDGTGEDSGATLSFKPLVHLKDTLLPVSPFPYEILPDALKDWVMDNAERIGCPPDFIAINCMVVLSSLLGRKVLVKPKRHDNWIVYPNLWGVIIGRSSTKKSPSMDAATIVINKFEMQAREAFKKILAEFEIDQKVSKLDILEAQKAASAYLSNKVKKGEMPLSDKQRADNRAMARNEIKCAEQGQADPPTAKRYIIKSATVEKLAVIMEVNQNGLLTIRDELIGWLMRLDQEERAEEREFYLMAFNGNQSYSYDRISRESVFIQHCICSMLGGIQPSKLLHYMRDLSKGLSDDGLFQRFQLMTYPDHEIKEIVDRYPNAEAKRSAYAVFELFNELPEAIEDSPVLSLSHDAQTIFDEFQEEIQQKAIKETNPAIESHLLKMPATVASLALSIHIADSGVSMAPISQRSLFKACGWAEYLEPQARRVYAIGEDPLYSAKKLIEKLPGLPNPFTTTVVILKKWSGLDTSSKINSAIKILIEHGYLARLNVSTHGRTKTQYFINPNHEPEK
jgi:hypothetical protein